MVISKFAILVDRQAILRSGQVSPSFSDEGFKNPRHAYRFLFVEDTLVIGAIADHQDLYWMWSATVMERGDALASREMYRLSSNHSYEHNPEIPAAGMVNDAGVVTGWNSVGMKAGTREEIRPAFVEKIMELYRSGALALR